MEYLPFLALRKSELSHLIIVSSLVRVISQGSTRGAEPIGDMYSERFITRNWRTQM